ncbi:Tryp_SPc [Seminavis robusta]|uniref:Tryp_SPc n=1 Tax=Seminavis robusta TaxID=568900 RepID=A0A9N8D7Q1_9STRA|nr:Tryp_SPc [Seminavis robusta]|eukprot:Sro28_g018860.1 Tryp_SPc (293) ;mRNA; f:142455-143448
MKMFSMRLSLVLLALWSLETAAVTSGSLRRKLPEGGSNAASGQIKAFVELVSSTGRICSGVLIKPDIVATAASCTFSDNGAGTADFTSQAYVKGTNTESERGISRNWADYVVHPDYSYGSETNNVAVILLSSPVETVETLDVNLWTTVDIGTSVMAAGYGSGRTDRGRDDLTLASLMILNEGAAGCITGNIDQVICADSDTQDMCEGDEGSPLMDGDNLVGIYSHGGACDPANGSPKFMRAPYFRSFIQNETCNLNAGYCSWLGSACQTISNAFTNALTALGFYASKADEGV